ncbi:PEP-CTERM/exosortase system-associated acyltransferase [Thiohalophilus sp.]|uniref:PEP-CTERM/exosortase system-associated acyltransferase n=1 Tax=Thiohalophilus sp. TaxID=3028392 RepID=UPI002ACDFD7E|nr:PEP-CTERM/exosortase system-associated acyltransferase [Thiohalophilus sp.]MDZ7803454.1 PEP-CTERM/exosortase system-associated acyltransferase [Thiohalophilus sp.]
MMIAQPNPVSQPKLSEQFHRCFEVIPANTPELKNIVYRIRYEVYCLETGFEDPRNFPDGLERDEYDDHALHALLRHRSSGEYAGCVRLITDRLGYQDRLLFPFERFAGNSLRRNIIDPATLPRGSFGEISRLAVRSQFRRRANEQLEPGGNDLDIDVDKLQQEARRRVFPHIALGLYLAGAALAITHGMTGAFVMMEPRLARHMQRYGIIFRPAGEVVEYHGLRGPFYISAQSLHKHLKPELRGILDTITAAMEMRPYHAQPFSQFAL